MIADISNQRSEALRVLTADRVAALLYILVNHNVPYTTMLNAIRSATLDSGEAVNKLGWFNSELAQQCITWSQNLSVVPADETSYKGALEAVLKLATELCDAVDRSAHDIGGSRKFSTIIAELGPACDKAADANPNPIRK